MESRDENEEPFGRQVYDELKRQGGYSALTVQVKYEGMQKLKDASREEMVALFQGSEYTVLQRIRSDTPAELAAFLMQRTAQKQAQAGMAMGITFMGLMIGQF